MKLIVTRKQLAELLRHRDTNNIRQAIKRGRLVENKDGLIDVNSLANRKWLELQIKNARKKGYVVDIDFDDYFSGEGSDNESEFVNIDNELKKARIELVKEQTKTTQLNREISLGKYLKASIIVDALKIYLDQTFNIANTNIGNVITRFCKSHGINKPDDIVKIKSDLTEALNLAIHDGTSEVMRCVERMVDEQIDKLAKK